MIKQGVSIIIINYNTFELTCKCIESINKKTSGIVYEIILVDNGSIECNPDIFKEKFPQIILVKSPENLGFSKGNNLGINYASYEYLLLLNSDTELINNAIFLAHNRFIKNKNIGALSAKLLYNDGRIQFTANTFPSLKRELRELSRVNKFIQKEKISNYYLGDRFNHLTEQSVDWIWGAFFMTRKSIINEFPGKKLHEDFFMYWEDVQWSHFIKKRGYEIIYYPEAEIIHHLSGSLTEGTKELDKYKRKILPNMFLWMIREKGKMYTFSYFLIKIIHALTLRTKNGRDYAIFHFMFLLNHLKKSTKLQQKSMK
jgi:GT2 family glycosyltransferase